MHVYPFLGGWYCLFPFYPAIAPFPVVSLWGRAGGPFVFLATVLGAVMVQGGEGGETHMGADADAGCGGEQRR